MEKQKMYLVPEAWLKSLLENAAEAEKEMKSWGKEKIKCLNTSALIGYAKSAEFIMVYNKIEKKQIAK